MFWRRFFTTSIKKYYKVPSSLAYSNELKRIDQMRQEYHELFPGMTVSQQACVRLKMLAEWTSDSNRLESTGLNRGDTIFFLRYGITVSQLPLSAYFDTVAHVDAIEYLEESLKHPITNYWIRELHALLFRYHSISTRVAAGETPRNMRIGQFKATTNSVIRQDGTIHHYVDPILVSEQIDELTEFMEEGNSEHHPVEKAAIVHYNFVRIHPFDDGNGRIARLLMNFILLRYQYYPCSIRPEVRREYSKALEIVDRNDDLSPLIKLLVSELCVSYENVLSEIRKCK